jgi:hypothetical protein
MSLQSLPAAAREFFTLTEREREARVLPEEERTSLQRALRLAAQKREAAETLWPRGSTAEGLKLASASLDTASSALDELSSRSSAPPPWLSTALSRIRDARRETSDLQLPALEADVRPSDEATFRLLVDTLVAVEEAIATRVASPAEVAALRRQRWVTTAISAVGLVVLLGLALRTPAFTRAEASAADGEHVAERAIDGDVRTWWVLPSSTPGWLDLTLPKARAVPKLRIVAGNTPWNDHLLGDAHIEAFFQGILVKAIDVTFRPPPSAEPDWTEVRLDAPKCDRIRVTARTAIRGTPAIAEIEAP